CARHEAGGWSLDYW
nr:immunoglobulin heavy chain junction region [Macaca mulatta]MOX95165.1 immunoglobulin heavy chain junction region [Macaca mulatta]